MKTAALHFKTRPLTPAYPFDQVAKNNGCMMSRPMLNCRQQ